MFVDQTTSTTSRDAHSRRGRERAALNRLRTGHPPKAPISNHYCGKEIQRKQFAPRRPATPTIGTILLTLNFAPNTSGRSFCRVVPKITFQPARTEVSCNRSEVILVS